MTIDEAIRHCEEVAEQNETSAITYKNCKEIKTNMYEKLTAEKAENDCRECAADHRQLAEWLKDYKLLRGEYFKCQLNSIDDYRREAARCRAAYFSLSSAHSHLTIRQTDTYQELQEAKRLLKLAVEDFTKVPCNNDAYNPNSCGICVKQNNCNYSDSFKWRYTDEALALIGEDGEDNE